MKVYSCFVDYRTAFHFSIEIPIHSVWHEGLWAVMKSYRMDQQETQLSLTNRAMCLQVSQGHQSWYHSIC